MRQVIQQGGTPARIIAGCGLAAMMATLFVAGGLIAHHGTPFLKGATAPSPGIVAEAPDRPTTPSQGFAAVTASPEPDSIASASPDPVPPAELAETTDSDKGPQPPAVGMADTAANAPSPGPVVRSVPLPVRRPTEFRIPAVADAPRPRRRSLVAQAPAQAVPQKEDERSFVEKLFGIDLSSPTPPPALAYAALEPKGGAVERGFRQRLSAVPPTVSIPTPPLPSIAGAGGVAVYDITAQVVTLPNGEKLEAHSGLGDLMDKPTHVHVPMRGATPIGTYDLTERERLFHGVRAIRLNPVGGSEAIHGRVGLLAHTYMLGPKGASNGCVSFRNYERFLQAYLSGEVRRLVVVAGT